MFPYLLCDLKAERSYVERKAHIISFFLTFFFPNHDYVFSNQIQKVLAKHTYQKMIYQRPFLIISTVKIVKKKSPDFIGSFVLAHVCSFPCG